MNQTTNMLAEQVVHIGTATAELKALLADDRAPEAFTEIVVTIATTAAAITPIGPIGPNPPGLYSAWSEVVLVLVAPLRPKRLTHRVIPKFMARSVIVLVVGTDSISVPTAKLAKSIFET
jgi:hypothetical protein